MIPSIAGGNGNGGGETNPELVECIAKKPNRFQKPVRFARKKVRASLKVKPSLKYRENEFSSYL